MKPWQLLTVIIAIAGAVSIGWFFETRPSRLQLSPLEVPDNIDYYLANFSYRALDDNGLPHFELQSPYLEHYIREDVSQIEQPFIIYQADPHEWRASAEQGSLSHQQELLQLNRQVDLQRIGNQQPLQLNTEVMILETRNDQIELPEAVKITTDTMILHADNASLDILKNYYQFNQVRATYHRRNGHEPG
ncbi:MAG: LPS export ABC transporter periplasmic protein LptC [Gammaproteobacteria bacterium]|nr:LPS export ABC transporter periplasmic protein LptC [Gammaproteobacteria bacterium]